MWPVTNRRYCILLSLNLKHIHIFKAWIIKKNLNTFEHGTKLVWTVALQPFGHEATIFLSEIIPKSTSLVWSTETCMSHEIKAGVQIPQPLGQQRCQMPRGDVEALIWPIHNWQLLNKADCQRGPFWQRSYMPTLPGTAEIFWSPVLVTKS